METQIKEFRVWPGWWVIVPVGSFGLGLYLSTVTSWVNPFYFTAVIVAGFTLISAQSFLSRGMWVPFISYLAVFLACLAGLGYGLEGLMIPSIWHWPWWIGPLFLGVLGLVVTAVIGRWLNSRGHTLVHRSRRPVSQSGQPVTGRQDKVRVDLGFNDGERQTMVPATDLIDGVGTWGAAREKEADARKIEAENARKSLLAKVAELLLPHTSEDKRARIVDTLWGMFGVPVAEPPATATPGPAYQRPSGSTSQPTFRHLGPR